MNTELKNKSDIRRKQIVLFLVLSEVVSLRGNHLLCLIVTILGDNAQFYFLEGQRRAERRQRGTGMFAFIAVFSPIDEKHLLFFLRDTLLIILPRCSPSRPWLSDFHIGPFCNKARLLCATLLTADTFFNISFLLCCATVRCLTVFLSFLLICSFDVSSVRLKRGNLDLRDSK